MFSFFRPDGVGVRHAQHHPFAPSGAKTTRPLPDGRGTDWSTGSASLTRLRPAGKPVPQPWATIARPCGAKLRSLQRSLTPLNTLLVQPVADWSRCFNMSLLRSRVLHSRHGMVDCFLANVLHLEFAHKLRPYIPTELRSIAHQGPALALGVLVVGAGRSNAGDESLVESPIKRCINVRTPVPSSSHKRSSSIFSRS